MTVAVLGAGPAGLYAALQLARRGIPVTIYEREDHVGGLAAGRVIDGQRVDHGSHRLHPTTEVDILEDLRGLLGDDLQNRPRNGRIHLEGAWLSFPLSPGGLVTSLPPAVLLRLATGALVAAGRRESVEPTFAEVVESGLGRPMGELFYFPYARKIWGLDPTALSGSQARRRIAADSPAKLIRKALSPSSGRTFYYPAGGFGSIPESIAAAAAANGVELRLGVAVERLRPTEGGWRVETAAGAEPARLVLSTVPLAALVRMLPAPDRVRKATARLRSRAMVLVYLTVPSARWTPYDAHYFPSAGVPFTRISEPKNYRSSSSDPPGRSVLCVEIPCDIGDSVWNADDADLARDVRRQIGELGLPDPGQRFRVARVPSAYPVYHLGAEADLDVAYRWVEDQPGLVTFGRQGLFAHDNTHHALVMARDAAACVSPSLTFDRDGWARARERFARHVVED